MAWIPVFDKKKDGEIVDQALIDDEHVDRCREYTWVYNGQSVTAQVNRKTITLPVFLFGKQSSGEKYLRRDKRVLDYREENIYKSRDKIPRLLRALKKQHEDLDASIEQEEETPFIEVAFPASGWTLLIDKEIEELFLRHPWHVSIRKRKLQQYCYIVRSASTEDGGVITFNLARVILSIQDESTGETLSGMEGKVASYKNAPDFFHQVLDLRKSNLLCVERTVLSYRRRKTQKEGQSPYIGVMQEKSGKWRAVIKIKRHAAPIKSNLYDTDEQAAKARDALIKEYGLEDIIRLNFPTN
jgi:hypothetical protein